MSLFGREKLVSIPSGGGGSAVAIFAAPVGGVAVGSAAPASEAKEEKKVEEKEESDGRENAVNNSRAGKTWVLIATDVVARGMDFKGRSGRAGRTGETITFYTEEDILFLHNVANHMAGHSCKEHMPSL